jgi:peptidoglycan hydrolase CwlO-like protein
MLKFARNTKKTKKLVCVVSLLLAAVTLFISSSPVIAAGGYSGFNDANVTKLENTLAGIKKEINALQTKINNTKNDKKRCEITPLFIVIKFRFVD